MEKQYVKLFVATLHIQNVTLNLTLYCAKILSISARFQSQQVWT